MIPLLVALGAIALATWFSIAGDRLKIKLYIKQHIESKNWKKHKVDTKEVLEVVHRDITFTCVGKGRHNKGRYRLIGFSSRFLTIFIDKIRSNEYDLVSARPSNNPEKSFYKKEWRR